MKKLVFILGVLMLVSGLAVGQTYSDLTTRISSNFPSSMGIRFSTNYYVPMPYDSMADLMQGILDFANDIAGGGAYIATSGSTNLAGNVTISGTGSTYNWDFGSMGTFSWSGDGLFNVSTTGSGPVSIDAALTTTIGSASGTTITADADANVILSASGTGKAYYNSYEIATLNDLGGGTITGGSGITNSSGTIHWDGALSANAVITGATNYSVQLGTSGADALNEFIVETDQGTTINGGLTVDGEVVTGISRLADLDSVAVEGDPDTQLAYIGWDNDGGDKQWSTKTLSAGSGIYMNADGDGVEVTTSQASSLTPNLTNIYMGGYVVCEDTLTQTGTINCSINTGATVRRGASYSVILDGDNTSAINFDESDGTWYVIGFTEGSTLDGFHMILITCIAPSSPYKWEAVVVPIDDIVN